MAEARYEAVPIGWVEPSSTDPGAAPKQGDEGSPHAELVSNRRSGRACGTCASATRSSS